MATHRAILAQQDWEAVHADLEASWLYEAQRYGTWVLGLLVVFLIVKALARRHRYRAVEALSAQERATIEAEVAELERKMTGEIVLVVVERSDAHPSAHPFAALAAIAAGSVLAAGNLPWDRPSVVLLCQLAFGAVGYALSYVLPDVARLFVSEKRATEMAEEQALQEFQRLEIQSTAERTGILILTSLFERRAVVLADEGIHTRVPADTWVGIDREILTHVRRGALAEGLLAGARAAGRVLAAQFPSADGGDDELPNQVILRRE